MKKKNTKSKIVKFIVIAVLTLFVLFSAASFILINTMVSSSFARVDKDNDSGYLRYEDVQSSYSRELLSFYSGDNLLQGYLYGEGNTNGLVVVSHGLGCGAEDYLAETLYFVDNGYTVFAYDNTGCDLSEGESSVGLQQSAYDNDAALTFIESEERFNGLPVLLYGHSWGAYAVTAGLNYSHDVAAVVSVSGFNKPVSMMIEWGRGSLGWFAYAEYPYVCVQQYLTFGENMNLSAVDGINSTDIPVLLVHGTNDTGVPADTVGTVAFSDEITNPNVRYKMCDKDGQNGHNDLFLSQEALAYADEIYEKYDILKEECGGSIPQDLLDEFFDEIDRQRISELDEEFMGDILSFYESALEGTAG